MPSNQDSPPTLTLQLPFLLLARSDVSQSFPTTADGAFGRRTSAIALVNQTLKRFCPDVGVRIWVGEGEGDVDGDAIRGGGEAEGGWVLRCAPEMLSVYDEDDNVEGWDADGVGNAGDGALLPGWRKGDAMLTAEEKKLLGKSEEHVWSCSFVLLRHGIPLPTEEERRDDKRDSSDDSDGDDAAAAASSAKTTTKQTSAMKIFANLEQDLENIFAALHTFGDFVGDVPAPGGRGGVSKGKTKKGRWFLIPTTTSPQRYDFRIGIHCSSYSSHSSSLLSSPSSKNHFNPTFLPNILLLLTALEPPLTLLCTPTSLSNFISLSRLFVYRGMKALRKERRDLWKTLKRRKSISDRRRGVEIARWEERVEKEGRGMDRDEEEGEKEERKELWEEVDEYVKRGEESVIVEDMLRWSRNSGKRLGLGLFTPLEDAEDENNGNDPFEEEDSNPDTNNIMEKISTLVLQGHPASPLSAPHILAYTDIFASIIWLAHAKSYPQCRDFVQKWQVANAADRTPLEGLVTLCGMLGVRKRSLEYFKGSLRAYYPQPASEEQDGGGRLDAGKESREGYFFGGGGSSRNGGTSTKESVARSGGKDEKKLLADVFTPLERYLEERSERERAFMPTFVQRYGAAEGFCALGRAKLLGLVRAEGRRRELGQRRS